MEIIEKILENPLDTNFDVTPLIHGSMRDKAPDLQLAIDGIITPEQALKLTIIRQHYDNLETLQINLEKVILSLIEPYQKELNLIATVPAIKTFFCNRYYFRNRC